jgi:trigger factor
VRHGGSSPSARTFQDCTDCFQVLRTNLPNFMPDISRQDLDSTSAVIAVSVSREELQPVIERALKKFKNRAALKGFRQGHAPMPMIKRMFGGSILVDELNDMVSQELQDYLQQSGLDVLGQPIMAADQPEQQYNIDQLDPVYTVRFDIGFVPPFEVKGLDATDQYDVYAISDIDTLAEKELETMHREDRTQEETEGPIEPGDLVRITATELADNTPKEGGWVTDMFFDIDSIINDQLKQSIVGLKKGDVFQFNPRDLDEVGTKSEDLFRKYLLKLDDGDTREVSDWFEGVVDSVVKVTLPQMDESFFKRVFGETTTDKAGALAVLKEGIRSFYQERIHLLLARDMQLQLLESNDVQLPETFLKRWMQQKAKTSEEALQIEEEMPKFIQGLKWTLISDKIKATHQIAVEEADLLKKYAARIRSYFQGRIDEETLAGLAGRFMREDKNRDEVVREVETDKIFAQIRQMVTLIEKPITSEAFHAMANNSL